MQEKFYKLYELILTRGESEETKSSEITTKELYSCGFTPKELTKLAKEETSLKRLKRGVYTILDETDLYRFGLNFYPMGNFAQFKPFLELCFRMNPTDYRASFDLFVLAVINNNFEEAFKYYDIMLLTDSEHYKRNNNFFLVLLSKITTIPLKYKELLASLKLSDILVLPSYERCTNIEQENELRTNIFNGSSPDTNPEKVARDYFSKLLKLKTQKSIKPYSKQAKDYYMELIRKGEYEKLKEILMQKQNPKLVTLLHLVNAYLEISKTRVVPVLIPNDNNSIPDAIANNDFERVRTLMAKVSTNTPAYLVVDNLCSLSEKIKAEILSPTINDIFNSLQSHNKNRALEQIKNYLIKINKEQYEFLLIRLLRISIIENDLGFSNFFIALTQIENGTYSFNIDTFISYFNEELELGNFIEAGIYLEIILKAKEIFKIDLDTSALKQKYKRLSIDYNLSSLLDNICLRLHDSRGLIILDNIDANLQAKIEQYLESYPFIKLAKYDNQLVLRYYVKSFINLKKLNELANQAFRNGLYERCINLCLEIISHVSEPQYYNYELLGRAYLFAGQKEEAIKYLTVAVKLGGHEGYLRTITTKKDQLAKEATASLTVTDFRAGNFSSIPNIDTILQLILVEGMNIEEACSKFNLAEETVNIIRLILVQEYYIRKNPKRAEDILKEVRKSPYKNSVIIAILNEFSNSKNKKLLQNRESVFQRILEKK